MQKNGKIICPPNPGRQIERDGFRASGATRSGHVPTSCTFCVWRDLRIVEIPSVPVGRLLNGGTRLPSRRTHFTGETANNRLGKNGRSQTTGTAAVSYTRTMSENCFFLLTKQKPNNFAWSLTMSELVVRRTCWMKTWRRDVARASRTNVQTGMTRRRPSARRRRRRRSPGRLRYL